MTPTMPATTATLTVGNPLAFETGTIFAPELVVLGTANDATGVPVVLPPLTLVIVGPVLILPNDIVALTAPEPVTEHIGVPPTLTHSASSSQHTFPQMGAVSEHSSKHITVFPNIPQVPGGQHPELPGQGT